MGHEGRARRQKQPPTPQSQLPAFDRALSEGCYGLVIEIIQLLGWSVEFNHVKNLSHWEAALVTNTSMAFGQSSSKTESALRALKRAVEIEVAGVG